jgi:hypothetical protein
MPVTINGGTGVTIGTGAAYTFGDASTQTSAADPADFGFKNRIINGAMVIDQRNAGASVTPTDTSYSLDRWSFRLSQASKFTTQQNAGSVTPPAGYTNYLGVTSSSAYSVVSTDFFTLVQYIEGYNVADLGWGTANAQTVTLSFWVRSSLTGTFGGSFNSTNNGRSYPFTYTISSANTWEQKTVTIAGDTSGTWETTNTRGMGVRFNLGAGSTYSGTANTWASASYFAPTGAVSVVGTSGATFYITGVQLEKNTGATGFDVRPYGTELMLCQRYYEIRQATTTGYSMIIAQYNASNFYGNWDFKATKRATPTLGGFSPLTAAAGIDACTGYFTSANVSATTLTASAEL